VGRCIVFLPSVLRLLVTANVVSSSLILVTLKLRRYVPPKRREPDCVTSQKTEFFSSSHSCVVCLSAASQRTRILSQYSDDVALGHAVYAIWLLPLAPVGAS
jgi:hypothetical protein